MTLAVQGCAKVIKQRVEILVQGNGARIGRAVKSLMDERDGKDALLGFRKSVRPWRLDH